MPNIIVHITTASYTCIVIPLELTHSSRDSITKARLDLAELSESHGLNRRDELLAKLHVNFVSYFYLQWNPDFSNPQPGFSNLSITRTKSRFPSSVKHCSFTPRFLELSDFSNQFSFPLEVRKIGIPLYMSLYFVFRNKLPVLQAKEKE